MKKLKERKARNTNGSERGVKAERIERKKQTSCIDCGKKTTIFDKNRDGAVSPNIPPQLFPINERSEAVDHRKDNLLRILALAPLLLTSNRT